MGSVQDDKDEKGGETDMMYDVKSFERTFTNCKQGREAHSEHDEGQEAAGDKHGGSTEDARGP